uniref:Uncharacterized protein n=1 Tax=Clytia hemisphaerica TaxID=252671 RepID=A0A7M6DR97_9CNID
FIVLDGQIIYHRISEDIKETKINDSLTTIKGAFCQLLDILESGKMEEVCEKIYEENMEQYRRDKLYLSSGERVLEHVGAFFPHYTVDQFVKDLLDVGVELRHIQDFVNSLPSQTNSEDTDA